MHRLHRPIQNNAWYVIHEYEPLQPLLPVSIPLLVPKCRAYRPFVIISSDWVPIKANGDGSVWESVSALACSQDKFVDLNPIRLPGPVERTWLLLNATVKIYILRIKSVGHLIGTFLVVFSHISRMNACAHKVNIRYSFINLFVPIPWTPHQLRVMLHM